MRKRHLKKFKKGQSCINILGCWRAYRVTMQGWWIADALSSTAKYEEKPEDMTAEDILEEVQRIKKAKRHEYRLFQPGNRNKGLIG